MQSDTPWRLQVSLLGLATIGAYGVILYGFGALVAPIREDTGWSNSAIAAAFSVSTLAGGIMALGTGRLLDRIGSRPVMLVTLVIGSALLLTSSTAEESWIFIVTWGSGGAIISSGLFYNATMAVTTRIVQQRERARAFTWLTVIGGLASPIAFPLTGWLVEAWGWRGAARGMVGFMVICAVPAIVAVRGNARAATVSESTEEHGFADVRSALASPQVRRWLLASSAALAGLVSVQVHHVAAIESTGVTIGVASTLAGIRGFLSLPGRGATAAIASRIGVVNSLRVMYACMAFGTVCLAVAGAIGWVWMFVIFTGAAFGSIAPLQGLYASELYGSRSIGTLMGMQQVVLGAASAAGPFLMGLTIDATGGYVTMLLLAAGIQIVALTAFKNPTKSGSNGLAS